MDFYPVNPLALSHTNHCFLFLTIASSRKHILQHSPWLCIAVHFLHTGKPVGNELNIVESTHI